MEKEKSVVLSVTEQDLVGFKTLENACQSLSNIAAVFYESTNPDDHIQFQNPRNDDEIIDLGDGPTFALTIEGIAGGVANELRQAGHKDIVKEITKRHGIQLSYYNQDE